MNLSPRVAEAAGYLQDGLCNKDIARAMGISAHTVKLHLQLLYATLGVHSRAEAIVKLWKMGEK